MIRKTLSKIESAIQKINQTDHKKKTELLSLFNDLKKEVEQLEEKHSDQAESIAGFTEMASHEAKRGQKDASLLDLALNGLESSVQGFEASHPKLVDTVNRICALLSNMGI